MKTRRVKRTLLAAAAATLAACTATAYINPGFTPVNLVEQADCILLVKAKLAEKGDRATIEVMRKLKVEGEVPESISVNLAGSALPEQAEAFKKRLASLGDEPVLLLTGKGEEEQDISYMHVMGKWFAMGKGDAPGAFDFIKEDPDMEGTWAGGTDMLVKIVDLLVKQPETSVPTEVGSNWAKAVKLGTFTGSVTECRAVDLDGSGKLTLYFGCAEGDRLYACEAKGETLADRTAALGLSTKSRVSTWADLNGDGKLDLASWDGKGLSVVLQKAGGGFEAAQAASGAPQGECLGLLPVDAGAGGKSGLLWSSPQGPVVLEPGEGMAFTAQPLAVGKADLAALGTPGRCLLADFNGDGLPDVLFPFTQGSLFFAGKGGGAFAEAAGCVVALGQSPASCFTGDYDMDGRLDVCTVAHRGVGVWQNRPGAKPGEVRFEDMVYLCGEMTYISQGGGLWGNTCDVNNDGMQDTFWVYSAEPEKGPHIFFNRGFRSFGHGHAVDISENDLLNSVEKEGQQHGIVADLTDDGAQDMALVLKNGDTYFFRQDAGDGRICVRVALPPGAVGPVKVTAWETAEGADKAVQDIRCLGAWNVVPGLEEAFFGVAVPGTALRLSWQLPGSDKPVERSVTVEDAAVRIVVK